MSYSNASRRAIAVEDVPAPNLDDIRFETSLRRAGKNFTTTLDRRAGRRTLGTLFPRPTKPEDWESSLDDLSRVQGLSDQGHTREAARGRRDEPVAHAGTTTRTLARRG